MLYELVITAGSIVTTEEFNDLFVMIERIKTLKGWAVCVPYRKGQKHPVVIHESWFSK